jgi:hypothetical protein
MQLDKFSEESVGLVESGITDFSLVHDACKAQHVNEPSLSAATILSSLSAPLSSHRAWDE